MNFKLKNPNFTNFSVRIELCIWIMSQVFKQPKIFPAFWSNGFISSAGNQNKTVNWKIKIFLFDYTIVNSSECLLTDFSSRRVSQNIAFEPIVIRIFASDMEILYRSHNRRSHDGFFLN